MDAKKSLKPAAEVPGIGIGRDLTSAKANGAASLGELKEFFANLRGRNPQEVVGLVSSSLLIQSIGISCAVTAALVAVFTIGPYLISGPPQVKAAATKPDAAAQQPAEAAPAATPATAASTQPDAAKAMQVMGEDETKLADPKANPLDKNLDKLLDGID